MTTLILNLLLISCLVTSLLIWARHQHRQRRSGRRWLSVIGERRLTERRIETATRDTLLAMRRAAREQHRQRRIR